MTHAELLLGAVSFLSSVVIILGGIMLRGLLKRVSKTEEELDEVRENYIGRFEKLTKVVTDNKDEVKDLIKAGDEKNNLNHIELLNAIHASK